MHWMRAELHVHTVLSPCASVEMIPPLIVAQALQLGIHLIGITDHNTSANVPAVIQAAQGTGLTVIPGMEVHTQEDVHVLTLFNTLEELRQWQAVVDQALPDIPNQPEFFGEQYIVDQSGEFLSMEKRLLIQATELTIEQVFVQVTALGGLVIPAHVDRKTYGLIGTLGFIPPGLNFSAVEISRHTPIQDALRTFPQLSGYPLIQSGDVHHLDDFLGANQFFIETAELSEIKLALAGLNGRCFTVNTNEAFSEKSP